MSEQKRKPKATGPRTEVFAMRLDPKLKYLAEIAARTQRRSLANFIEWAIELGIKKTTPVDPDSKQAVNAWEKGRALWDVEPADRLANLAFEALDLMSYDEQVLWKLICETGYVWKATCEGHDDWKWDPKLAASLRRDRLRECWPAFQRVAIGEADRKILPKTSKANALTLQRGDRN